MIKRITLDTNGDVYGVSNDLYVKIINDDENTFEILDPGFTELLIENNPTGVYVTDIDIDEGKYTILVINDIIGKQGSVRASISNATTYDDLSDNTAELSDIVENIDNSSSFS